MHEPALRPTLQIDAAAVDPVLAYSPDEAAAKSLDFQEVKKCLMADPGLRSAPSRGPVATAAKKYATQAF
jgi:hypothetical protein